MLLSARELSAGYGAIRIVNAVSIDLAAGETLAVLGRNGVGKTTLLRALVGLADRPTGVLEIDGEPIPARRPRRLAKLGVAFVPDDRGVFPRLTVAENLQLAGLVGYSPSRIDPYALFPDLAARRNQPAGTLSGGQQQQLAIGRALATGPRLLVIDELSQGLQPSIVGDLADALLRVTRERQLALILVEQNPELATRICERVIVMQRGEIAIAGTSAALKSDPRLVDLLVV
jgi:ABC-type branched-subunit amino acid transport system ATPase component